jgi:hypothetical protein
LGIWSQIISSPPLENFRDPRKHKLLYVFSDALAIAIAESSRLAIGTSTFLLKKYDSVSQIAQNPKQLGFCV